MSNEAAEDPKDIMMSQSTQTATLVGDSSSAPNSDQPNGGSVKQPLSSEQLKQPIEAQNWHEIEDRFQAKLEEIKGKEQTLITEYEGWVKMFEVWATTTIEHEEERASKRLKTRIEHVRGSEAHLEEKRQHYVKVVEAFQSALALLE